MADDRQNGPDDLPHDLDARIARAKAGSGAVDAVPPAKGYAQGSQVIALLIGAPLGGGLMGWAIDRWLGTSPWALLILLTLAVIGAFMNIMRLSKERPK